MEKPYHSIFLFLSEIDEDRIHHIFQYIKQGIKIYLFTFDSLENYESNEKWKDLRKKGLFEWWEVPYRSEYEMIYAMFVDGEITDYALYEYICNTTGFNREQYEVEHTNIDHHLMVSAGAGTGKTMVMINRLIFLKHMIPELSFLDMVMITFTNEAASQMRNRLTQKLLHYYDITKQQRYLEWLEELQKMPISTIHSFGKTILEKGGSQLGFSSIIQVRSYRYQKKKIIEKWIDEFATQYPDRFQSIQSVPQYQLVDRVLYINQVLENKSINKEKFGQLFFGEEDHPLSELIFFLLNHLQEDLAEQKKINNEWEINDLIRELEMIHTNSIISSKFRIHFLFVDEFQDTDENQVRLLLWLQQELKSRLFIVGDTKQSIYRFRGADYTAFQQLKEGLKSRNEKIVEKTLVKNYRSTETLLTQMNPYFKRWGQYVGQFPFTIKDQLQPMIKEKSEGIIFFQTFKIGLKQILNKLQGTDATILVRTNKDVQEMVDLCERLGFFCDGEIKGDFYRSIAVREFYIMIRALYHDYVLNDYLALHRSSYGGNTLTNMEVINSYTPDRRYMDDLLKQQPDWELWNGYKEQLHMKSILSLIREIVREQKPAEVYAKRFYMDQLSLHPDIDMETLKMETLIRKREYQLNLDKLLFHIYSHFSDTVATLHNIEKFVRLHMETDVIETPLTVPRDEKSHRFQCMTVHKAKGLEFDHVILPITSHSFVYNAKPQVYVKEERNRVNVGYKLMFDTGTQQNSLFSKMVKDENKEIIGEEARLLYVAMTRAKKNIYIHLPGDGQSSRIHNWSNLLRRSD